MLSSAKNMEYECTSCGNVFIRDYFEFGYSRTCPQCGSKNTMYTRRIKKYVINENFILYKCFEGDKFELEVIKGIPRGSVILQSAHDHMSMSFYVYVWNINFDLIEEGAIPPTDYFEVTTKDIS